MKLRKTWYADSPVISLAEAIARGLDTSDGGIAERSLDVAKETALAVENLVEMLHAKGVLSKEDALSFVGYAYELVDDAP